GDAADRRAARPSLALYPAAFLGVQRLRRARRDQERSARRIHNRRYQHGLRAGASRRHQTGVGDRGHRRLYRAAAGVPREEGGRRAPTRAGDPRRQSCRASPRGHPLHPARQGSDMIRVSEMVLPGHPDKFCDQVADAIIAECVAVDADAYGQVEVSTWSDQVWLSGGVCTRRSLAKPMRDIVVETGLELGYVAGNHIDATRYQATSTMWERHDSPTQRSRHDTSPRHV